MNIIRRDVFVLKDEIKWAIDYVQGTDAIPIEFTFRDFNIPAGSAVRVLVEKPSGYKRFEDVSTVAGNVVTVNPDRQMMAEAGIAGMQLEVVQDGSILVTFVQPVNVKKSGIPVNSQSGSGFLEDIIKDAGAATDRANETSDRIEQKAQDGDFSATVRVGKTDTGASGTTASVKNMGNMKDAILDFVIPQGAHGDSGIMAPTKGFFVLWVDSETGNLYCDFLDDEAPPRFELEENGDLYMAIQEGGTA